MRADIVEDMEIHALACPWCGEELRIPQTLAGRAGRCRHCGRRYAVAADARALSPRGERPLTRYLFVGFLLAVALLVIGYWWVTREPTAPPELKGPRDSRPPSLVPRSAPASKPTSFPGGNPP